MYRRPKRSLRPITTIYRNTYNLEQIQQDDIRRNGIKVQIPKSLNPLNDKLETSNTLLNTLKDESKLTNKSLGDIQLNTANIENIASDIQTNTNLTNTKLDEQQLAMDRDSSSINLNIEDYIDDNEEGKKENVRLVKTILSKFPTNVTVKAFLDNVNNFETFKNSFKDQFEALLKVTKLDKVDQLELMRVALSGKPNPAKLDELVAKFESDEVMAPRVNKMIDYATNYANILKGEFMRTLKNPNKELLFENDIKMIINQDKKKGKKITEGTPSSPKAIEMTKEDLKTYVLQPNLIRNLKVQSKDERTPTKRILNSLVKTFKIPIGPVESKDMSEISSFRNKVFAHVSANKDDIIKTLF